MSKCDKCIFREEYRDMGFKINICSISKCKTLEEAIKEAENSDKCTKYTTREEVLKIKDIKDKLGKKA